MIIVEERQADLTERIRRSGRGNLQFRMPTDGQPLVLKLYRRRRSLLAHVITVSTTSLVERKRGATPAARRETERRCLDLWSSRGFDVFRRFDRPMPEGVSLPGLWLEYCSGRTLVQLLRDDSVAWEEKRTLIRRLAAELQRRHVVALAQDEILLVQEHASGKHVFLSEGRMIFFDLESGFRDGFSVGEALTQELAGYLRSILRPVADHRDEALDAFIEGYESPGLLVDLAGWGVYGRTLYRVLKRFQDQRRRASFSKTGVLRMLLDRLLPAGQDQLRQRMVAAPQPPARQPAGKAWVGARPVRPVEQVE